MKSAWNATKKRYNRSPLVLQGIRAMAEITDPEGVVWAEANDCAIRSIAFAAHIPYWKVAEALWEVRSSCQTRNHRKGSGWFDFEYEKAMEILGLTFVEERRHSYRLNRTEYYDSWGDRRMREVNTSPTMARVLDTEAREGRYLIAQANHLVGVVDGVPHHCTYYKQSKGRRARTNSIYLLCID